MFAFWVVEELDVIEDVAPGVFAGFVFLAPYLLAFEQVEAALDDRVVPAVPTPAHAWGQIVLLKELLPLIAGELGTLVGMHVDLGLWFAPPNGHQEGLRRQIGIGAAML